MQRASQGCKPGQVLGMAGTRLTSAAASQPPTCLQCRRHRLPARCSTWQPARPRGCRSAAPAAACAAAGLPHLEARPPPAAPHRCPPPAAPHRCPPLLPVLLVAPRAAAPQHWQSRHPQCCCCCCCCRSLQQALLLLRSHYESWHCRCRWLPGAGAGAPPAPAPAALALRQHADGWLGSGQRVSNVSWQCEGGRR